MATLASVPLALVTTSVVDTVSLRKSESVFTTVRVNCFFECTRHELRRSRWRRTEEHAICYVTHKFNISA